MPQNIIPIATQPGAIYNFASAKGGLFDRSTKVRMTPTWSHSGAPTNGTSGTLAGKAAPGDLLVTDEPAFYQNTNTLLSPTWTALTTATGAGTYTGTFNGTVGATTPAAGAFTTLIGRGATVAQSIVRAQGAPAAKTVSATLTAAELCGGIITVNQGAAGVSNLQSPTGTAIQTLLGASFTTGDSFDVSIINLSSTAAEIANLTVNTGVTIVGTAAIAAIAAGVESQGTFRFRNTAANTFVVYRVN